MKLIVGLGNPGMQYRLSRHNAGFLIADQLAFERDIPVHQTLFDAHIGKGKIDGDVVILAKPQTFMNLSGMAVRRVADYFRIAPQDLIVVHDDLDLPFGTIRLKAGGGHGGHKGLISLIDHLGSADFLRVRFGIGRPMRKEMVEGYVLSPFSEEERSQLAKLTLDAAEAVAAILSTGLPAAMEKYHGKREARRGESSS